MKNQLKPNTYTICESTEQCKELFEWADANGIAENEYETREKILVVEDNYRIWSSRYEGRERSYTFMPLPEFIARLKSKWVEGNTLQSIQDEIHEFANTILPNRPITSPLRKLQEEVAELLEEPDNIDEFADCFLVLLDAAKIAGLDANAILQACSDKMKINRTRKWGKPNEHGVFSHIKEQLNNQ